MENLNEISSRNPINGTFELTVRCNLKCKMCLFRHDDSENTEIMAKEKTAGEWIDMARQVAELGTLKLLITGGEPMLRPDFCEIYEEIYKMGFIIELYTNATMITPKIKELLVKYPPHRIGVTLYGASPDTYKNVCGNADAYEKAIEGIKFLHTLPSKMDIRLTIIKDNEQDFEKMYDWIKDTFNNEVACNLNKFVFKPVRGGVCDVESCRLSPKENMELIIRRTKKLMEQFEKINNGRDVNVDINNIYYIINHSDECKDIVKKDKTSLYNCKAGMNDYTISWDGKLLGCQMLQDCWTYPFIDSFENAWLDYPSKVKLSRLNASIEAYKCDDCENSDLCSTCVATRMAETGESFGCPKYICDNTEEIKKYLIENKGKKYEEICETRS